MKIVYLALAAITLILVSTTSANAQANIAPSSQLGIGVNTAGASIQYAINPGLHIGLNATFGIESSKIGDSSISTTVWGFGPYARFLFEGALNPFVEAGVAFADRGSSTASTLYAAFGLQYFASRNVGVFAETSLFEFQLDPQDIQFGIINQKVGVEWFFDR